ncbi:agmatinase [Methanococcus voltae]|uniref:agmatinase n=1 Tax=Methanococcus voltae TaxID=2188 RepID=UPI001AE224F6|nr:agmatinase [Methanococcus voltae]MBP2172224.1 agmatinase [Methanococcus voltae]
MYFEDLSQFICAYEEFETADFVIFGIPYDSTTSYKPGARFGPDEVRKSSWGLETYSPTLDLDLIYAKVHDAKNVDIDGCQSELIKRTYKSAKYLLEHKKIPVMIGGEHSVSYPVIKAVAEEYKDIIVVHFDAHCDLRDEYHNNPQSHACVIKQSLNHVSNVFQFGIRSGDSDEWEFARTDERINISQELPTVEDVKKIAELNKPIYITVDIDVLDPAFAPGTGTPEPCGFSTKELINSLYLFRDIFDKVVGFDVVEVSPPYDMSGITSIAASKILREMILMKNEKKNKTEVN